MTFALVTYHNRSWSKSSGTTLLLSPISAVPVGAVAVIRGACDNADAGTGTTTHTTITDAKGNTWTRLQEEQNGGPGAGAAATGVVGFLWFSNITTQIETTDAITLTLDAAVAAKAMALDEYSVATGFMAATAGAGVGNSGTGTAPSITISGLASAPHLYIAQIALEGAGSETYTQGTGYTATTAAQTSGGTDTTNVVGRTGYRVQTSTTSTYAPTLGTSRLYVASLAALVEVAATVTGTVSMVGAGVVTPKALLRGSVSMTGAGVLTSVGASNGGGSASLVAASAMTLTGTVSGPIAAPVLPYTIVVRNAALARVGKVDRLLSLDVIARFNAVGGWEITLPLGNSQAELFAEGSGVIIHYGDEFGPVLMSGPITELEEKWGPSDPGAGTLVARGLSDDVVVTQRLAYQVPTNLASSFQQETTDYSKITGPAETVIRSYVNSNIGPGAYPARRVTGLTLSADGGRGSTVTGSARMTPLGDLVNSLATPSGLGWRVWQSGSALRFEVFAPVDRTTSARFAPTLGNLVSYSYTRIAPKVTRAIVAGSGEGTDRVYAEIADTDAEVAWGFRAETLIDARDSTATVELELRGTEALVEGGPQTALSIQTIDISNLTFGTHYGLGDKVTIEPDTDRLIQDVLREVHITWSASDGPMTTSEVGTSAATGTPRLIKRQLKLEARVAALEAKR